MKKDCLVGTGNGKIEDNTKMYLFLFLFFFNYKKHTHKCFNSFYTFIKYFISIISVYIYLHMSFFLKLPDDHKLSDKKDTQVGGSGLFYEHNRYPHESVCSCLKCSFVDIFPQCKTFLEKGSKARGVNENPRFS